MYRHAFWTLVTIVAVVASLVGAGGAYYVLSHSSGAAVPEVVASFYPYQYLASRVAGDRFSVRALVPPGVEPHDWEPTPRDSLTIAISPAIIYNGYVEAYLANLFRELPADRPIRVNASAGLEVLHGGAGGASAVDPHLWLDPVRMERAVDTIAAGARITWTWNAAGSHSIQSTGIPPAVFRNSVVMSNAGSSYSVRIFNPGTYDYDCMVHGAAMTGRIVVK